MTHSVGEKVAAARVEVDNPAPAEVDADRVKDLNGIAVDDLRSYTEAVRVKPERGQRRPVVTARWETGTRARVEYEGRETFLGGDGDFNAMQSVLAALAACEVDVIATHAALMGIRVESLAVETTGVFDVGAYLGLAGSTGSGFREIECVVHIDAPGATPEQLSELRRRCEFGSPVGDTLTRSVPVRYSVDHTST